MKKTLTRRNTVPLLAFAITLTLGTSAWAKPKTISVPAGSIDALAAAVSHAGPEGTVLLKKGLHKESGVVLVTHPLSIVGEDGAVIESGTSTGASFPITIAAAIHVKNTHDVTVRNILFRPAAGQTFSTMVLIEKSDGVVVSDNRASECQFGVIVQHGDHAVIQGNSINITGRWQLDPSDPRFLIDAEGVIVINGQHAQIADNEIANGFVGIFGSDRFGQITRNTLTGNYLGVQLCHELDFYTISGVAEGAAQAADKWMLAENVAHGNSWGLQITDSSHDNLLIDNDASGNGVYDIEFTGDTTRFAPFPPVALATSNNVLIAGRHHNVVVKDCGDNDKIIGRVILVDHITDPCF